jgi:hypothetical protein
MVEIKENLRYLYVSLRYSKNTIARTHQLLQINSFLRCGIKIGCHKLRRHRTYCVVSNQTCP